MEDGKDHQGSWRSEKCRKKLRTVQSHAEWDLVKEIKTSSKRFYNHINKKKEVGLLNTDNGVEIRDNLGMAQNPNKSFASVFNKGSEELRGSARMTNGNKDMEGEITTSKVEIKLKQLNGAKLGIIVIQEY